MLLCRLCKLSLSGMKLLGFCGFNPVGTQSFSLSQTRDIFSFSYTHDITNISSL